MAVGKWWPGVAVLAAAGATQLMLRKALPASRDDTFYRRSRLPKFAPPAAAFPIAWSINAISLAAGLVRVSSLTAQRRGRRQFVYARLGAWMLFASFNAVYFGLRSSINAAVITFAYAACTAKSLQIAVGELRDARAAWSLATTCAWLCVALPLAVVQAAWNRDDFWCVGPFAAAPPGWERAN